MHALFSSFACVLVRVLMGTSVLALCMAQSDQVMKNASDIKHEFNHKMMPTVRAGIVLGLQVFSIPAGVLKQ